MCVRVALADRPGPARSVLERLLRDLPDVELVGVVSAIGDLPDADVVLIDGRIPGAGPLPDARVVVMGLGHREGFARRAARLGAAHWLPKDDAADLLPPLLAAS